MVYMESHITFYGNTMVFHGHCMGPWYSVEVFMG